MLHGTHHHFSTRWLIVFLLVGVATSSIREAAGQGRGGMGGGGFGFGQAVGGIAIDAEGIINNINPAARQELSATRRAALAKAGPLEAAAVRHVSLAGVIKAIDEAAGGPLPPEVIFLAGLQRVTHVFVDPDGHDIVLAGPAEAITIDAAGNAVGAESKRPPLQLEDLVAALRAIDAARSGGIRCSIDPTPEGLTRLQALMRSQRGLGANPDATLRRMEEALGPQVVSVGGVPGDTRFAHVLVAADYRMKRIGMGLEPSGVPGLPSYTAMVPAGGSAAALPRFWLEPTYEPLSRDPDELAWQINGRHMTCLTESDLLAKGGVKRGQGAADGIAKKWCAAMTTHYDTLATRQPVFADLVNCIDLAVVAALIQGRQLDRRAGLDLAVLLDDEKLPVPAYRVATTVPTIATKLRKGNGWVVTASGGVQFQPWAFATESVEATELAAARTASLEPRPADRWYW
jgi:hypothetical protein